jgi:hypothetical protein
VSSFLRRFTRLSSVQLRGVDQLGTRLSGCCDRLDLGGGQILRQVRCSRLRRWIGWYETDVTAPHGHPTTDSLGSQHASCGRNSAVRAARWHQHLGGSVTVQDGAPADNDDHNGGDQEQVVLPGLCLRPNWIVHLVAKQHEYQNAASCGIEHRCHDHAENEDAKPVQPKRPGRLWVPPSRKAGKCHRPQAAPKTRPAHSDANRRCKRGSATPRDPNLPWARSTVLRPTPGAPRTTGRMGRDRRWCH